MTVLFKKMMVLSCLLFVFFECFSQKIILTKASKISILTCDKGNESNSLFGHTAIRVSDSSLNLDLVYNYGAFDFQTPNFVAKFAKGDLQYFVVAYPFADFLNQYTTEKRSVYEQELILSQIYKQKLFDNLNAVLASEKKYYTYKFIDRNCTTMVVDILNETLGEKVIYKKNNTDISYRSVLFPYFDAFFYQQLGTSIIFGTKVDEKANRIFLPLELHENLKTAQINNKPLCKSSKTLLKFESKNSSAWWENSYFIFVILINLAVFNHKFFNSLYLILQGLLGVFFIAMGFYSKHHELAMNYNVLLFNPLFLILVLFFKNNNQKWIKYLAHFCLAMLVFYTLFMLNKIHLKIVFPFIITNFLLITNLLRNELSIGKHL